MSGGACDAVRPVCSSAYRGLCDTAFWFNEEPWEHCLPSGAAVVFCKIDEVWRLFRALRRRRAAAVIVTGEGDKPVSPELWAQRPLQVRHWFGINMFVEHPASTGLPLGLGEPGAMGTLEWEEIQAALANPPARDGLLYANFGTASNPALRGPLLEWVRQPAQGWITCESHTGAGGKAGYLRQLLGHKFVMCPPGNGEDTHRMWEALYCGAVPVVRSSPVVRQFPGLPMVEVADLRDVTPRLLEEAWTKLRAATPCLDYLCVDYWRGELARRKAELVGRPALSHAAWLASWMKEILRVLCGR